MPAPHLIGFTGYARSGKDASAIVLEGLGYRRRAFSDAICELAYEINPLMPGGVYVRELVDRIGWEAVKDTVEGRRFLNDLGLGARLMFGNDIWIAPALDHPEHRGHLLAVTGVRFPNEAQAIVDRGGQVWRVNKPGVGPGVNLKLETSLDDWPFDEVIDNDGTLEDLAAKVTALIEGTASLAA